MVDNLPREWFRERGEYTCRSVETKEGLSKSCTGHHTIVTRGQNSRSRLEDLGNIQSTGSLRRMRREREILYIDINNNGLSSSQSSANQFILIIREEERKNILVYQGVRYHDDHDLLSHEIE